jgi:hypothetical protein
MSDTPRTDALFDDCEDSCGNPWEAVSADFARQLERELAAAKDLAESNGKLAHDLGIKLTRSRQTRVCLFCGMESVTYVR